MSAAVSTNDVSPPSPPVIEVTDVAKTFDGRNVLDGVSLTVRRGETLVIMGASGCGKSTLLRCLIGAHSVDKGSVKLFGKDIATLRQRELDAVRKRYGILFQSGALFSSMSVGENVALPLKEHTKLGNDMIDLMVKVKLELVGLREAEDRLPSEISGGMAKRAGLARAIALDPELLFYDEPTSGLDPIMTGIIDSLITDLARTMNVTSVVVTHDLQSAFRVADRMVVLNNGRIVLQGLPHEIRASQDPFVRRFIHGPTESKTVMIPRGSGSERAGSGFVPPIAGAALVSSGIRRAVNPNAPSTVPVLPSEISAPIAPTPPIAPIMPMTPMMPVAPAEPAAPLAPAAPTLTDLLELPPAATPPVVVIPPEPPVVAEPPPIAAAPKRVSKSEMVFMRRSDAPPSVSSSTTEIKEAAQPPLPAVAIPPVPPVEAPVSGSVKEKITEVPALEIQLPSDLLSTSPNPSTGGTGGTDAPDENAPKGTA